MSRSPVRLVWPLVLVPFVAAAACSSRNADIGSDCDRGFCKDGPTFGSDPDAGRDATPGSTPVCPVTSCTLPWATCPSSKFPCDVDLLNDDENCGGCGIRCVPPNGGAVYWHCVAGQCTFGCQVGLADCDGDPGTGCETSIGTDNDNCGACGYKCPDGTYCGTNGCVNDCYIESIPDLCGGTCTNLLRDDLNCGACGNVCDPTGPNLPALPADMRYGCAIGTCGHKICGVPNTADCNNDVSDGCETVVHTNENCGGCHDKCSPGKTCGLESSTSGRFACLCDDERETYCGGDPACRSIADDLQNCGGCDRICPGLYRAHFEATCTFGVCGGSCAEGYADCDGLADNGCEVNTRIDNRNCGACGNACLHDQVCAGGRCLVEPCDAGTPQGTTK